MFLAGMIVSKKYIYSFRLMYICESEKFNNGNNMQSNSMTKITSQARKERLIDIKDVYKIYKLGDNELCVLSDINLTIYNGDFVIILGPSGSGKSTLLNIVGCLDNPSKGTVYLKGNDIVKLSESSLARLRGKTIGFIFQEYNLIPSLNALENVMLPLEFQNVIKSEARAEAERVLCLVDLKDRLHHLPRELSGGQQQRIAIARALSGNPEIILADEPTGNLDSKNGAFIMDFLKDLNKKGKTIIMVTHDLNLVKYGSKIVHIIDGKINKVEEK
jgi:putative ABC transport system ATP-binding protein